VQNSERRASKEETLKSPEVSGALTTSILLPRQKVEIVHSGIILGRKGGRQCQDPGTDKI
jgi:hypothetical protein